MAGVFGRQSPREDKIMNRNSDVISDDVRGKKVNDRSGDDKNRKKKGGCLKGIITCGVSLLIVVVVLVGGGLLIGNGYLKQNYGFGIGDAFAILKGLKTDGSKIVEQSPSENEQAVTDMCDELGGALMLKDGTFTADDISAIVSSASGGSESSGGSETEEGAVTSAIRREEGVSGGETDGGAAEDPQSIGDMLLSKLKYDNVDENKLVGIDDKFGESADFDATFSVTITPQAISAIAYGAIEDKLTELLSAGNASGSILDGAKVEQVFVKVPEGATDPRVTITLSLPVKANVGTAMSGAGMPSFLVSVAQAFLPEKMYLTCYVDLIIAGEGEERTYDFSTDVVINSMNDEQRQSTYKVIGGVLKMTSGETVDPKEYLNDIVKNYVSEPIRKADEMLDIKATCTTGYELEVFQIIADQAFAGKDETIYNAESVAALYTGILDGKLRNMKENNKNGLFRSEETVDGVTTETATESQNKFVEEFCKKYLIASEFWKETDSEGNVKVYLKESGVPATAEKITLNFNDVLALMGMKATDETAVQVNGIEVQSLVDTSKIGEKVGETNIRFVDTAPKDLRLNLTEKMLGAVLENKVSSSIVGDLKKYDLQLEFVRLPKNDTLKLGFSAKKDVITANAAKLKDLFAEDRIGIVVVVPLAKNEAGEFTEGVKVYYSSVEDCNRAEMISKILMDYLAADDLRNIQTEIRTALNEVENKLGAGSLSLNTGTASMASLFDVLATEIFDGKSEKLSAEDLQTVMQGLYTPLTVETVAEAEGTKSYLSNGKGNYTSVYGSNAGETVVYENFVLEEMKQDNALIKQRDNQTEKAKKFSAYWSEMRKNGKLNGGLKNLSNTVGYYHNAEAYAPPKACTDDYIYITFEYEIHDKLNSGSSDQSFGADKIYATFIIKEVDLDETRKMYCNTKLIINNTQSYNNLQILLDALIEEGSERIKLSELADEVGAMMYAYHSNNSAMEGIEKSA